MSPIMACSPYRAPCFESAAHPPCPKRTRKLLAIFRHLESARPPNGGLNLARDGQSRGLQQPVGISSPNRPPPRIESFERLAKSLPPPQDNKPGESGLKPFQHERLPKGPAVDRAPPTPHRDMPKQGIALRPLATLFRHPSPHWIDLQPACLILDRPVGSSP